MIKKKNLLEDRHIAFASSIIALSENINDSYAKNHLRKQLIRSSTSAALNYGEAQAGESRADFIHKMRASLKELKETFICLKLLRDQPSLGSIDFDPFLNENNELISIFVASVNTTTAGLKKK